MASIHADEAIVFYNGDIVGKIVDPIINFTDNDKFPSSIEYYLQQAKRDKIDKLLIDFGIILHEWTKETPSQSGDYWFVGMLMNKYSERYSHFDEPVRISLVIGEDNEDYEVTTPDKHTWQIGDGIWYGPVAKITAPDGWEEKLKALR